MKFDSPSSAFFHGGHQTCLETTTVPAIAGVSHHFDAKVLGDLHGFIPALVVHQYAFVNAAMRNRAVRRLQRLRRIAGGHNNDNLWLLFCFLFHAFALGAENYSMAQSL